MRTGVLFLQSFHNEIEFVDKKRMFVVHLQYHSLHTCEKCLKIIHIFKMVCHTFKIDAHIILLLVPYHGIIWN